jgi:hypothetical protein
MGGVYAQRISLDNAEDVKVLHLAILNPNRLKAERSYTALMTRFHLRLATVKDVLAIRRWIDGEGRLVVGW